MSQHKKEIRRKFREAIFERDNYKCVLCGETEDLDAHHITNRNEFKNGGYIKENGVTLCPNCHYDAEIGLISSDRLYQAIKSSLELAQRKDNE